MQRLHIANTDFEFELSRTTSLPLEDALEQHPVFLQLQFLPMLYAQVGEGVAVTALPEEAFYEHLLSLGLWSSRADMPKLVLLHQPLLNAVEQLLPWGRSPQVAMWANRQSIPFSLPAWETTCQVNSKQYSFNCAPKLPHARLLWNEGELADWLQQGCFDKVLKQCYGFSGRGHRIIPQEFPLTPTAIKAIQTFCQAEWSRCRPIIAEPWVSRLFDFSTQWYVEEHSEGEMGNGGQTSPVRLLGATVIKNNARGAYESTLCGEEKEIFQEYYPFLEQHKAVAHVILKALRQEGFFGHVGIDALIYKDLYNPSMALLHPIVEINARQTMSLAALMFRHKWFPQKKIAFSFSAPQPHLIPLLPTTLAGKKGTLINFTKQLYLDLDPR